MLGLGGIQSPEDVLEYLIVGASAVQVGTAHFIDPGSSLAILEALEDLCQESKVFNINELRGTFNG